MALLSFSLVKLPERMIVPVPDVWIEVPEVAVESCLVSEESKSIKRSLDGDM